MNPSVSDTTPPAPTSTAKAGKPPLMARFKALLLEYGPLAFVVHYVIFGLVLGGFYVAIKLGFRPESAGEQAGTWAAAYALSQVVKPLRLAGVFVLTPLVARIPPVHRFIERNKHKWSM
ncbi:FAM210 family protein [Myxococcus stipitatus]|uniref:FAM210 family protein n=1 Tax=Myxococcus stipitatus TaxID=83455 RepID=UPI001F23E931|nr:FAM210 family protein [Myxococcus stipitatus]MCE9668882.1 FAM210 family protein [Myxococcus stipitatus]